jgi:hypothetical protein
MRRDIGAAVVALAVVGCTVKALNLVATGGVRELRQRPAGARPSSPGSPPILLLAFDGTSRDLLYEMLRAREMPRLAELLGGGPPFAHAYLDDDVISIFPSITMAAWVSALTGRAPADTGVPGNEFFIRERGILAAPSPISFDDPAPTIEVYNDGYLDDLVQVPTVYEQIHARDPDALIWVSMAQIHRGADKLLLTRRTALVDALEAYASQGPSPSRQVYAAVDTAAVDLAIAQLDRGPAPDVMTLYFPGIDSYAHVANEGPDRARRAYLSEVVDPALGKLADKLRARHALDGRWVVVTADHGHTEVMHDQQHAIATDLPRDVLRSAGFRVRAFQRDVGARDPFSAVIAYGGATAYVYVADRSRCAGEHDVCPWKEPPRYREDVLAAAEAFYRNNVDGEVAPGMRGALDLILVREPRPYAETDLPFEVYVGDGKTMGVEAYLEAHPHPTYVDFPERLRALAVGVHGERAGDLMLIPHDGDRAEVADRFYFAAPYRSFHGSASRQDSEVPMIVANPRLTAGRLKAWVDRVMGPRPTLPRIAALLMAIRGEPPR